MAEEYVEVKLGGETRSVKRKTLFLTLAKEVQDSYDYPIMLASIDNKLRELNKGITKGGELHFVTLNDSDGRKTYRRSLTFLMERAVRKVTGNPAQTANVQYSINNGYYCEMTGGFLVTQQFLDDVRNEMRRLVELDLPLTKESWSTEDAIAYFASEGMKDKESLFRYRRSSRVNVYVLDGYRDYYYGYMVPSTGCLNLFDLEPYHEGFVLTYPLKDEKEVRPFLPSEKFFHTLKESDAWGNRMGIETIGDLNDAIVAGSVQNVILTQEALMERRLGALAEEIESHPKKKFVLIAGPSSSGKTTFSHRLSVQLRAQGLNPHPFPLDDYYVDREFCPRDEDGNFDFECIESLDIPKLNEDLEALLAGKEIEKPLFNFKTGKREPHGRPMRLDKGDVLVIEGIHGLNERLSASIDAENKFKIYISPLTAINIDEHNYLPTTDARLLRRIVRDARTRGSLAQETIGMWESVRRGERKWIFPFQEEADVMFNSALLYELAVMKTYAEPLLFAVDPKNREYAEAKRLLKFLDYFLPLPSDSIQSNSILREFIGGGCFGL
ncbi:MAG: nucleoside kinase [Lachnospiraceae bacterium]|nr:nucleoside kinase [Lachnospiraceae bacterium]